MQRIAWDVIEIDERLRDVRHYFARLEQAARFPPPGQSDLRADSSAGEAPAIGQAADIPIGIEEADSKRLS